MAASFGGTTRSRQLFGVEAEHTRVTVILRVCDFFDVVKNRGCKQNSYDDKLVINSKKSQTLSAAIRFACESYCVIEGPLPARQHFRSRPTLVTAEQTPAPPDLEPAVGGLRLRS